MKKSIQLLSIALAIAGMASLSSCGKKNKDVLGCMTPTALNYNSLATKDDGTCELAQEKKMTLLMDATATWCGPCGSWGTPTFKEIAAANPGKCISIAVHPNSSDLKTSFGNDMLANWLKPSYYPCYFADGVKAMKESAPNAPDLTATKAHMNTTITDNYSTPPLAGSKVTATVSGTTISIKSRTKFFEAGNGDYTIAFYLTEDNVTYKQNTNSGYNNTYVHNHLLRQCYTSTYGDPLISGPVEKGKVVELNVDGIYDNTIIPSNADLIAVIYDNSGGGHKVVNAMLVEL